MLRIHAIPSGSSRREFLRRTFWTAGAALASPALLLRSMHARAAEGPIAAAGALLAPDANGIALPSGWTSRVVAVSGERPAAASTYRWHSFPDGGAVFPTADGGWAYANNSESARGGVGVLHFDSSANVRNATRVLDGTVSNCAGGQTPWGTWLSCEETPGGRVWETFPFGTTADAREKPALGVFSHEAAAVDPLRKMIYLTEDEGDGRFYRFVCSTQDWPAGAMRPALERGTLQVMVVAGLESSAYPPDLVDVNLPQTITWANVVSPGIAQAVVRARLGDSAPGSVFKGGEGIWYFEGLVYFSSKGDNRIWVYDPLSSTLECIYHFGSATSPNDLLSGVDNVTVSPYGDVLVAEDGGNMELCAVLPDGSVKPILRVTGQDESEITGPAFSPDGRRLYFNSQRGGSRKNGVTYELLLPD